MRQKVKYIETFKYLLSAVNEYLRIKRVQDNAYYLRCIQKKEVKKNQIMFESYQGVSFTGNPYAIFKKMAETYSNYHYIIAIRNKENEMIQSILTQYKDSNITIVEYESKAYLKALATSKYLVNDTSFMPYFIKREKQLYVNTWHGTPLKTLGKDIKNAKYNNHKNVQKNLLAADQLAMPNQFTSDILVNSHDINGITKASVLVSGNPRVDLTIHSKREEIIEKYHIDKNKNIVLFAPTWKKAINETTDKDIQKLIEEVNLIQQTLGEEYKVYLKAHYFIYEKISQTKNENIDFLMPNWVDTNELLAIVDRLITDYSSIFFDYLPLKKPIYFYMPDKEWYEKERGFYIDVDTLPGSIAQDFETLLNNLTINEIQYLNEYQQQIDIFIDEYCYMDDGCSISRVVDNIINHRFQNQSYLSDKKTILCYGGQFDDDEITHNLKSLSQTINYDNYEIILLENDDLNERQVNNLKKLDKRIHFVTQFARMNRSIYDTFLLEVLYNEGKNARFMREKKLNSLFENELIRILGKVKTDAIIDLQGFNKNMMALTVFSPIKEKILILHSDMEEKFNLQKNMYNFKVIFSMYDNFDKIFSPNNYLKQVNQIFLNDSVKKEKMQVCNQISSKNSLEK